MRKLFKMVMVLLTVGALVGCGSSTKGVADEVEKKIGEKADKIIEFYNEGDFNSIYEMGSEKLKGIITEKQLQEAIDGLHKEIGKFKTKKERKVGEKQELYLCVTLGEFDKGRAQVQTSFNKELELEGFAIVK